ncbi:hypothetical protein [Bacillus thuringiensis]|uniref:hypothetical protein n=1 Tax=Bacillus thuringiensis TaxID=1428 RepID=UPI000BFEA9C8|nr:hypothetical protein [Bacillus thuringiensis]PGM07228.1 hypothetical protein CN938_22205 [Bacillus thuringiensis]
MEDKIKARIIYLDRKIRKLEEREDAYEAKKLTKHGYISLGKVRGSVISKEMEISFLESLLK